MSDKTVFVTVGTTKFDDLITTVLNCAVMEVVVYVIFTFYYLY